MGKGNSHQRAVARPAQPKDIPWYERALFWGGISLAGAIVLTVIAAMQKDFRWLLIFAWPLAGISWWVACKELKSLLWRWILFSILLVGTGIGLWRLHVIPTAPKLTPEDLQQIKDTVRGTIENSIPPHLPEQPSKNGKTVKPTPPFSFAIDVAMFSPTRDRTVMLYLASPGINGTKICPANLALYLRLQNLQEIPARLSGWNLELGYGDKWADAVKLDSRFGAMYFVADDPKKARRIDSRNGFDVQLAARSYVIKPGDPVEGWALFEYPKSFPNFAGAYKLSVRDTLGHGWSAIVSWPDPKQNNTNLLGGLLSFTGSEDVSNFTVSYCDD